MLMDAPRPARWDRRPRPLRGALLIALVLALTGCASGDAAVPAEWEGFAGPKVAATVPPIVDIAQRVAGDRAMVVGLVPSGQDSHTYEPRPSDARVLSRADVFITPAESSTPAVTQLAYASLAQGARFVSLDAALPPDQLIYNDSAEQIASHGHGHDVNVHAWTNPRYAMLFAYAIARELSALDPDGAASYNENAAAFAREIEALDGAVREALATLPDEHRRLVVYHDSWDYFARDYGLEVVGSIQAADLAEPSAAEVAAMVDQIREAGVPAFFGSEVFPSDVLQALAGASGATYAGDLADDRLPGEPGDPQHSYVGMMAANVELMVDALGGDASAVRALARGDG